MGQKGDAVFFQDLGLHTVAGCPVINVGSKCIQPLDAFLKILFFFDQKGMEIIFFIIKMREIGKKFLAAPQTFGEFSEQGDSYADNGGGIDRWHQLGAEFFIFLFAHGKKAFANGFYDDHHLVG